jgi:hypothetical protein
MAREMEDENGMECYGEIDSTTFRSIATSILSGSGRQTPRVCEDAGFLSVGVRVYHV